MMISSHLPVEQAVAGFLAPPQYLVDWRAQSQRGDDVPRVNNELVNGCAFLFPTRQDAEARTKFGGTAFLVERPIANSKELLGREMSVGYLVTNRHVVYSSGASVVSLNRRDGSPPDIFEFEPTDWVVHPQREDLAAIELTGTGGYFRELHLAYPIHYNLICSEADAKKLDIGLGDEVFMVGRFLNHQGPKINQSSARFGSISMMPTPIWVANDYRHQESFAVEMRSRSGFSGSPVMVYRTPATTLTPVSAIQFNRLLGVNWGYILDENGENTWLNGVVPAWKILDLLEVPALKEKMTVAEDFMRDFASKRNKGGGGAVQASASEPSLPSNGENPTHREDFMRLVDAAARKPQQEG